LSLLVWVSGIAEFRCEWMQVCCCVCVCVCVCVCARARARVCWLGSAVLHVHHSPPTKRTASFPSLPSTHAGSSAPHPSPFPTIASHRRQHDMRTTIQAKPHQHAALARKFNAAHGNALRDASTAGQGSTHHSRLLCQNGSRPVEVGLLEVLKYQPNNVGRLYLERHGSWRVHSTPLASKVTAATASFSTTQAVLHNSLQWKWWRLVEV
jgi:hypothetical protein